MGIGIYPSENNLYLGMIGLNGVEPANEALKQCDLLIALGTAFSDRSTCKNNDFTKNRKVVSINISRNSGMSELNITADVKCFIEQCLENKKLFVPQEKWRMEVDVLKENIIPLEKNQIFCNPHTYWKLFQNIPATMNRLLLPMSGSIKCLLPSFLISISPENL